MISDQSKRNLETALHRAVRATLVRDPGDVCDIVPEQSDGIEARAEGKLLLLTLSAFAFRLMIGYRIADTPGNRAYYVTVTSARTLDDVFAELANMCTGALNRELSRSFPHLAMSTPYTTSGQCIQYLSDLKPDFVSSYKVTINGTVRLQATICMCCSAPIEFVDAATLEVDPVGELELF